MGLETHSLGALRLELSKEYKKRITYLLSENRIEFRNELEASLNNLYGPENKFNYLVSEKNRINEEIEQNNFPKTMDEWLLNVNDLMEDKLTQLDLSTMEMSNQLNIDLFLAIIEKSQELIDDATLFLNKLKRAKEDDWDNIIHQIGGKSKSNALFWDDFNKRFNYKSLDRSDESNLILIYDLGKDFYKNLNTKLFIVLNPYVNSKVKNKEIVLKTFTTVIQSFIKKEDDIRKNTMRIKKWYDENVEDITYKLLLMKIMDNDAEMGKNRAFELITNYKLIENSLLKTNPDYLNKLPSIKPEIDNLALIIKDELQMKLKLKECYEILEGVFIEKCDPIIFPSLFIENKFIERVNWIGSNMELRVFILEILDSMKYGTYWIRAKNCFLRKGKLLGNTSLSSPHAKELDEKSKRTILLRKAINCIKST